MDNDAVMLEKLGNAIVDLQVKYRAAPLKDRMLMRPSLDELLKDHAQYSSRLIKEGVITSEQELEEMKEIKNQIDSAASTQALIAALGKTIAFVATKI